MSFVLGLTGSIGMGKSTTATLFAEAGVPVWDADATVHRLYASGGAAALAIGQAFPGSLCSDGSVDRAALRQQIATDPSSLERINAIVHPLVAEDRAAFLGDHPGLVLLDVPLLFETGLNEKCDRVVVATVDAETQRRRVLARGTMTQEDLAVILSRQMPDEEKRQRADYLVVTDTMDHARRQVGQILGDIERQMQHA